MIDELRQFLLVIEHGTFTRAARHAHLSQPALSAAIPRLEQWMGARLLHRDRKGANVVGKSRINETNGPEICTRRETGNCFE